jgi:antitoxin ParD1/3/4
MCRNTRVILGDHFSAFVDSKIQAGRFESASEAVRAGWRLLEQQEAQLDILRKTLANGEAALSRVEGLEGAAFMQTLLKPNGEGGSALLLRNIFLVASYSAFVATGAAVSVMAMAGGANKMVIASGWGRSKEVNFSTCGLISPASVQIPSICSLWSTYCRGVDRNIVKRYHSGNNYSQPEQVKMLEQ